MNPTLAGFLICEGLALLTAVVFAVCAVATGYGAGAEDET